MREKEADGRLEGSDESAGGPRKVLLVSYNYPPLGTYGSVRAAKLSKYLPRCGWAPTVLTVENDRTRWGVRSGADREPSGVKIIRAVFPDPLTRAKDFLVRRGVLEQAGPGAITELAARSGSHGTLSAVRRRLAANLIKSMKQWAAFPDRYLLWFPFAFAAGFAELRREAYHAIWSTSPPVMNHFVAAALSRVSGLPWVADFRDPWSQNPYLDITKLQARMIPHIERRLMMRARALVTVSEPLAHDLIELHGRSGSGVRCITNGFDPDDYPGEIQPPKRGPLTLTYTGMFYGVKRDPGPILETIEEMIAGGAVAQDGIRIDLYGPSEPELEKLKAAMKYPGVLRICGLVPRNESIDIQRRSHALLVINWEDPYSAKGYGGKVFEYLGSRRPILAWNPSGGVLDELLSRTGAGRAVSDRAALTRVLSDWIEEYQRSGDLVYTGDENEISRYGWDRLAGEVAGVLKSIQ